MKGSLIVLIGFLLTLSAIHKGQSATCEPSWTPYNDVLCLKLFENEFLNYTEAQQFCQSQSGKNNNPSQLIIKSESYENFISDKIYGTTIVDDVWLGASFNQDEGTFLWDDGSPLSYTNWAPGYPRQGDNPDRCVAVRPNSALKSVPTWFEVSCRKRNTVVCQTQPNLTIDEIISAIIELRQQVVPIGFIYVEYPFNSDPIKMWPKMTWSDVSEKYSGHFFRVTGGGAGDWGNSQAGCAPRLDRARYGGNSNQENAFPTNGWSSGVQTGDWSSGVDHGRLSTSFHTTGCEVRPLNMPIRVWERVA